ncbi:hypothetical protein [Burkholderia cenocepacia]|jgi:hypothetical protein|uniref:Uncharacterized protein n=1 Tax=Burkholderia cenocepacia TaxID=95486 RepID=A0ABD4UF97_9BURK|nr:hypothetical protein [Burkholderia cenocepacia]MCW3696676.1 hypothetical protein [Burkholderia cenocepacia]MCW3704892.1 hypothetical protein [Burkholderia cenocepacia]MCW3713152.1 hypothetical protein [Burkholderia cenocepacia]MCW3721911.1 hypothetical protein [Burkholderia cenocepacia]MCW3729144.1 hypothetical protein [Burkholderia cenocepacia]
MARSLCDDVLAAFARACREREFDVAEYLLCAIEAIALQSHDFEQLDVAYALLGQQCDWPQAQCTKP